MRNLLLILFLTLMTSFLYAQNKTDLSHTRFQLRVKPINYPDDKMQLAYYIMDKQYLLPDDLTKTDTIYKQPDGSFIFHKHNSLEPGIYALVLHPKKEPYQLLITGNEQNIEVSFDYNNVLESIQFDNNSIENQLFYNYLNFLQKKGNEVSALTQDKANSSQSDKTKLINEEVIAHQNRIIKNHPNSLTASIIKANSPLEIPNFIGSEEDIQYQTWQFYKQYYLDNIDLDNPAMLRTPFLFPKVEYYIDKLQIQHPDSISKAIDFVLEKMSPSKETYKYYVVHFLNKYARSNIVGMDAVYVHMVDNYYAKGKAPWSDNIQLQKIIKNANAIKPTLIGKLAPNINLESKNGIKFNLHNVKSKYTVLFFWNENCKNCKKSITQNLTENYAELNNLNVKLIAVCTETSTEIQNCWDYVNNSNIQDWLHARIHSDLELALKKYSITSLPAVFVLDSDKYIVSKRIGLENLIDVINNLNSK